MTRQITIKLRAPVKNGLGQPITELTLRPMTGADIRQYGAPVDTLLGSGALRFNTPAIANLISVLGNIPLPSVDALDGMDWGACASELAGFFIGAGRDTSPPTSSNSPGDSPGSTTTSTGSSD